jgi:hypothetical protein
MERREDYIRKERSAEEKETKRSVLELSKIKGT